jgi:hypothetical protein
MSVVGIREMLSAQKLVSDATEETPMLGIVIFLTLVVQQALQESQLAGVHPAREFLRA